MAWKGFITESKYFMNYPKCGRLKFWASLPRVAFRFYRLMAIAKIRHLIKKGKQ